MTLKIGSRSPKSYQLVPPSQQCICASLVKIRPSVQKITCGNEATRTQTPTLTPTLTPTPTGSAPKTICPPLRLGGHNFVYTMRTTKCINVNKTKVLRFFLPSFSIFPFSISHSNVMNMQIFIKDFSGTTLPRILKFGTNINHDKLYCV